MPLNHLRAFCCTAAAVLSLPGSVHCQIGELPPISGPVYIGSIGELRQRVLDANWSIQAKIIFVDRTDLQQLGIKYDLGTDNQFFNNVAQRTDPLTGDLFDRDQVVVDIGGNSVSGVANADAVITGSALDLIFSTAIGGFDVMVAHR